MGGVGGAGMGVVVMMMVAPYLIRASVCSHPPAKQPRALSETFAAPGCEKTRYTGNDHKKEPFLYCCKTCTAKTIADMQADTSERDMRMCPCCGTLVWICVDHSSAPHPFCGRTCSQVYKSVHDSNSTVTE